MGTGYLKIETRTGDGAIPVEGAQVYIYNKAGTLLYDLETDANGSTEYVPLYAPDIANTLTPDHPGPFYATYDVTVVKSQFVREVIEDVQIFDTISSILPIALLPAPNDGGDWENDTQIPPPVVERDLVRPLAQAPAPGMQRLNREVTIPETITVHLGTPASSAANVRVKFADYIKNVASSEIYPTWPRASLEANIYAMISFALNRIYTEWYRSRGYQFDITSSSANDQAYVQGRDIFTNISQLVDEIFNRFVRRPGLQEPYFTQFCNGTTSTCPGLSQWGTVTLANQGYTPIQILRNYYPNDIQIITSENIANIPESYPGTVLREGSKGDSVAQMQRYLNRIRANYPLIPAISNPNGTFGADTTRAVRVFQGIFNLQQDGLVGSGTWYKIVSIYVAVTRLAELDSEGERIGIGTTPPTSVLRQGSRGADVNELQFILNYIAEYYPTIPTQTRDAIFGSGTKNVVIAFQKQFGLPQDGVVGPATWNMLYQVYNNIEKENGEGTGGGGVTTTPPTSPGTPYPGTLLRSGSTGESVRLMQRYLNAIAAVDPSLPTLSEDGIFGPATQSAVVRFQQQYGLSVDGIIGPMTWNRIVEVYESLGSPSYPGTLLKSGASGDSVRYVQTSLNLISNSFPRIPKLTVDGLYGPATRNAVLTYQQLFGLSADGIVGPLTWDSIVNTRNSL